MPQVNDLSRSEQQQARRLWFRGCVLAGIAGWAAVLVLSVNFYRAHQRPFLDVPPERINPNTASVASLVRLPGIGKARAMDIIDYRDHQPNEPVFQSPQDLEKIRGIGPKTAEKLAPWLMFNAKDATVASDANVQK
jgi:competence ComEA-like helix-hairpin-helix protein